MHFPLHDFLVAISFFVASATSASITSVVRRNIRGIRVVAEEVPEMADPRWTLVGRDLVVIESPSNNIKLKRDGTFIMCETVTVGSNAAGRHHFDGVIKTCRDACQATAEEAAARLSHGGGHGRALRYPPM